MRHCRASFYKSEKYFTLSIDHGLVVQVQEATLSEDRVPEHVRKAVQDWLL